MKINNLVKLEQNKNVIAADLKQNENFKIFKLVYAIHTPFVVGKPVYRFISYIIIFMQYFWKKFTQTYELRKFY